MPGTLKKFLATFESKEYTHERRISISTLAVDLGMPRIR
ncbi:hypothetical protein ANCDUO_22291, partial [Ancylostoma duodenale]